MNIGFKPQLANEHTLSIMDMYDTVESCEENCH